MCSSTSTPCSPQPLTREDVEGVYAGLRPLLTGESESTSSSAASTRSPCPCPGLVAVAGRQVHDLPRDGARRHRRRRPRSGAHRPALRHARHAAGRRRRLPGDVEPARQGSPPSTASTSRGSSTCCAATARASRSCWRWSRDEPELGKPLQGADDYLAVEVALRRHARGRAAPRRRAHPPHPHLDRDLGSRPRGGRRGRGPDRRPPRLGRRPRRTSRSSSTARRVARRAPLPGTARRSRRRPGTHERPGRVRAEVGGAIRSRL